MKKDLCRPDSKNMNFFVNSILHVLILLTILATFFFAYVSNLSKDKFHDELQDAFKNDLIPELEKADSKGILKRFLQKIDLNKVSEYYDKPNQATILQNNWLFGTVIASIGIFFLILMVILGLFKYFFYNIPIMSILWENIILFLLVGCIEISFFLFIGKNYIPIKPSLIPNTIINKVKKEFKINK